MNKVIIRGEVIYIRMKKPPYLIRIKTEKNGYKDNPCVEFEEPYEISMGDYVTVQGELKKGYNYKDGEITGSYMFVNGLDIHYVDKSWDPVEKKEINPLSENHFSVDGVVTKIQREHEALTVVHLQSDNSEVEISAFRKLAERASKLKEGDTVTIYGKIQTLQKRRKDGSYTNFEMPVAAYIEKK